VTETAPFASTENFIGITKGKIHIITLFKEQTNSSEKKCEEEEKEV
jgi:hypothetical protein